MLVDSEFKIRLLPYSCRFIGYGLMTISILFVISPILISNKNEVLLTVGLNIMLVALLILALTKAKVEDELTIIIRLNCYAFAFIIGVVVEVINPVWSYLIGEGYVFDDTKFSLMFMLWMYFFSYYLSMKTR